MASGHAPAISFGHGIPNGTASLPSRDISMLSYGWSAQPVTGTWTFSAQYGGPPGGSTRRFQRATASSAGARLKLKSPCSLPGQCPGFSTRRERMALVCWAPTLASNGWIKARYHYIKADNSIGWTSADFISLTGPVSAWALTTGELVHTGGNGISTQIELEIYCGSTAATRHFNWAFAGIGIWTYAASAATLEAPLVSGSSCRPVDTGRFGAGYAWGRPSTPPPGRRQPLSLGLSWGGVPDATKQALERAYAGSVEAGYQPGGWDGMGRRP